MDERSEIRKGIFYVLQDVRLGELTEYEATLKLQELGAVIKVEGELPEYTRGVDVVENYTKAVALEAQQDMLKAGYTLTSPLIKKEQK
uniref:Uncharacterized protein n=1 Tax=viral metagenome TaxID=1070528 RepID=A0A6M3XCP4_9ZZZZ